MLKKLSTAYRRNKQFRTLTGLLVVLGIAMVGTYLLTSSHAATPFASLNADSGTLGCGAAASNDATASNGKKVVFSGCSGGGSCTITANTTAAALKTDIETAASGSTICVDNVTSTGSPITYGVMTFDGGGNRTSMVTVKPVPGKTVTFTGQLDITGNWINLQDISLAGQTYEIYGPANHIQMTNVKASNFLIRSKTVNGTELDAQNITIKGGSIGPRTSYPDNWIVSDNGVGVNKNIMIDGVTIHDFNISSSSTSHFECLQVWAVDGLTVQNSTFRNCSIFDIFLQRVDAPASDAPPPPTNVLIQNNYFDCCDYSDGPQEALVGVPPGAIQLPSDHSEGTWKNITIRNNSSDAGIYLGSGPQVKYDNVNIENNILTNTYFGPVPTAANKAGLNIDYNLWLTGSNIGTHDLNNISSSSVYTNLPSPSALFADFHNADGTYNTSNVLPDLHLKAGSAAIDKGDPTAGSYPGNDIDGNVRPHGTAPDIGAYEF